jgi:hypothetical protein
MSQINLFGSINLIGFDSYLGVGDVSKTRLNLGLWNSALCDTGVTPGTVARGDHIHE